MNSIKIFKNSNNLSEIKINHIPKCVQRILFNGVIYSFISNI